MDEKIFIPKLIKVGFNLRQDTYTGKLAYVIYNDGKKWRKETSWESWRQKPGHKIHVGYELDAKGNRNYNKPIQKVLGDEVLPQEFTNEPIEGFVLNKKVGGDRYGWNPRQTYSRVYDPRGFEFEITIPNLLYILENANSYKGKGLEGKFIYGWQGKDLILIPEGAPEYESMVSFTSLQSEKVGVKDLEKGATYITKQTHELVYIDKFLQVTNNYVRNRRRNYNDPEDYLSKKTESRKVYVFWDIKSNSFTTLSGLTSIAKKKNEDIISNYSDIVDKWFASKQSSVPVKFVEGVKVVIPELREKKIHPQSGPERINQLETIFAYIKISENEYEQYSITTEFGSKWIKNPDPTKTEQVLESYDKAYVIQRQGKVLLKNNQFEQWSRGYSNSYNTSWFSANPNRYTSLKQINEKFNFLNLKVELADGKQIDIKQF